jgi:four helix bundle protein
MDDDQEARFEDSPAWQAAMALVQEVYRVTEGLQLDGGLSVVGQLRATAVMVPGKIAAGVGSGEPQLLVHNLALAYGSISEFRTLCYVAHDMDEIEADVAERLATEATRVGKLITKMTDNLPAAYPGPNGHSRNDGPAFNEERDGE